MKNLKMTLVMMGGIALAALPLTAETQTVGGYTWTYRINGDTAEIYGTYDSSTYSYTTPAISPSPTGAITIPSLLGGKPVTSIGEAAFCYCNGFTNVTIPASITSIGPSAFYSCTALTSVTIPDSVTNIGNGAFYGCSGLMGVHITDLAKWCGVSFGYNIANPLYYARNLYLNGEKVTDLEIPDDVTSIGSYAFYYCTNLTSVTIPNSVTNIGPSAFSGCSALTSVTIPDSVMSIDSSAFRGCSDSLFDTTTIPGVKLVDGWAIGNTGSLSGDLNLTGIRGVGIGAFSGCSGLTSVTIPQCVCARRLSNIFSSCYQSITNVVILDGVMSIGSYAFYDCSGLTSVTIPDSVTSIGDYAFGSCYSLKSVYITDLAKWCDISFSGYGANPLGGVRHLYLNGEKITDLTIPIGVTSVKDYAFWGCSGLTSVTIPDSVTSIGVYAFQQCSGLTSVTIPDSVTNIGASAFVYCSGLTNVVIGSGVTSIGEDAFYGCSGLAGVTLPNSVTNIGQHAFSGCNGLLSISVGAENVNYKSVNGLLTSKDGTILIQGVNGNVTIPNSVTSIGDGAFWNCIGLMSVTIPDSVTSIESSAFSGCSGLTSVTIPDSVTSIGDSAFSYCSSLTSVTIPSSVTNIGDQAFCDCHNVSTATVPGWTCGMPFDNVTNLVISAGTTSIGYWAFAGCSGLTSVTIPDGVTKIWNGAFSGCSGLTSVKIPDSVMSIGEEAFFDCGGLMSLTIPQAGVNSFRSAFSGYNGLALIISDSVTNIGASAFISCSGLMNVTIPDNVTSIGHRAFSGCSGLTSVTIPGSVTSIGSETFSGCSGLTSVTIPDSVTNIRSSAFSYCSSLTSVTIPNSVTNIAWQAFSYCSILTSVVFDGNAPNIANDASAFYGVNSGCTVYVPRGSTGWGVAIPGIWNGMAIKYRVDVTVTFNVGEHGVRTGGGALIQTVDCQSAAIAPDVAADAGWEFLGWDADFSCVVSNMKVNAIWRRVYTLGEAMGKDAASAALPWVVGTNGVAETTGDVDATAANGKSVKFTAADDALAWIEAVVTNSCRVSFDWKSSCEPLMKGKAYDYLSFAVDGVQQNFVCGETGWTSVTNYVTGEGEHHLRWMFQRDEDGSAGEDCAWLANVAVTSPVTVSFAVGGATAGTVPEPMTAYADERVTLPGQGSLALSKHRFLGWSDGATTYAAGASYPCGNDVLLTAQWAAKTLSAPVITAPTTFEADSATVMITADADAIVYYTLDGSEPRVDGSGSRAYQGAFTVMESVTVKAIAVRDDYFDSEIATATVTRLLWTFGEYLNCPERMFTTDGDTEWVRVKGMSEDGYALRSGAITHSQSSRLETVVYGAGTIRFSCKVDGEIVKKIVYDGLAFCIDGVQQGDLIGENIWMEKTVTVSGDGRHTLSWLYVKDEEGNGGGEDCAWLDNVVWTAGDALPVLDSAATDNDAKAIIAGLSDVRLSDKINSTAAYTAFRSWVDGKQLSHALVKEAPNAWLSYVLDAPGLMAKSAALVSADVEIESIAPSSTVAGAFDLVVGIAGAEIGTAARLAEALGIEGAAELNESEFSPDGLTVTLERTADGKAKATITPEGSPSAFFLRVKVK